MLVVVVVVVVVLLLLLLLLLLLHLHLLLFLLHSYATSTGIVSAGGTHSPYISATLPQGNKSEDYNIAIRVDIFDQNGASQADILTVKVSFLLQYNFLQLLCIAINRTRNIDIALGAAA